MTEKRDQPKPKAESWWIVPPDKFKDAAKEANRRMVQTSTNLNYQTPMNDQG